MNEVRLGQNLYQNLYIFIQEVENELKQAQKAYRDCLCDLVDKVKSEKPKTIFFLDRSARPVAWMLVETLRELQKSEPELIIPEIRFISLERKFPPNEDAFEEAQQKYKFDRNAPVMVIDEFSESDEGDRNVDYSGDVLEKHLGVSNIVKHVFMERRKVGVAPRFYKGSNFEKKVLYGIEDSGNESLISKASVEDGLSAVRNRYRAVFENFGKQVGKQLSIE